MCTSGSIARKVLQLNPNVQAMLNQFGTDLDSVISAAVQQARDAGVDIHFVNPVAAFTGHDVCGNNSWFHPLSVVNNRPGSHHPNPTGQTASANLANQCPCSGCLCW
jgi:hypothetical protein